jgi:hypothetical protein
MLSRTKQARDRIERLRLALLSPSPEEIGAALPGLEEAAQFLQTVEQELRDGVSAPHEVRQELKMLRNDLRISAKLIEHGMAFCRGWAQMIGASPAYTQAGQPQTFVEFGIESGGTLALRG